MHALPESAKASVALLKPEDAYRMQGGSFGEDEDGAPTFGANPPSGAVIRFWLAEKPEKPLTLEIVDAKGALIRKFESKLPDAKPDAEPDGEAKFEAKKGLNEFVWNLRYPDARRIKGLNLAGWPLGRFLGELGEYQFRRLTAVTASSPNALQ
ncbi:MAG: hypothetical protein U5J83_14855 [Bryobacterales bacterium]|nr:hypothetical protein [Bryobacterales bacterium]